MQAVELEPRKILNPKKKTSSEPKAAKAPAKVA
jgi:hypothetical protein